MLIIPVEQKPDLRNPPWATLLLILLNCLVFFTYQINDEQRIDALLSAYAESDLLEREGPLYLETLDQDPQRQYALQQAWEAGQPEYLSLALLHDLRFEHELHQRAAYREGYDWRSTRAGIETLRDRISYVGYGFIPAQPSLVDAFVSMFLHGDFGHLFGNMLFLFIFGFMLEIALGRGAYLGLYLLSGFGATGLYWLMDLDSYVYGVGASGAIAGLMGMYLGLYGMKRIQFFYWIGFYFNYFKAPALLLLPFWVGKELLGELTSDTNINYWAHIGGLLSGFVLILLYKRSGMQVDEDYLNKVDPEAPVKAGLARIDSLVGELALDQAKAECARLLVDYPQHLELLERYYKLLQNDPGQRIYHELVLKIFALPAGSAEDALVYRCYQDYRQRLRGGGLLVRLPVALKLARRFVQGQHFDDSARLVQGLVARGHREAALAALLLLLAKRLKAERPDESRSLLQQLVTHFPDSEQAQALRRARQGS